jgi:hypothetical protein
MPTGLEIDGAGGLRRIDVLGPDVAQSRLAELQAVHLRHFPDHAHVTDEMAAAFESGSFDPEVVVHQWLLLLDDEPVGEYIFHVNTRRGIMLRHFLAVDQPARKRLPLRWLGNITALVQAQGEADASQGRTPLLAMMSEVKPSHLEGWRRLGYRTLEIGYLEPFHGKHWPDFGEPEFFEMTPCVKLTDEGAARPIGEVAAAAVYAFSVDHYRLPEDNATVLAMLERARALES